LKPLRAGKVEEVPESRYAALFPPNVKTDLVLAKVGLTPKSFADWECKRPLDTDRLKDGKTPYFKGYFDAQDRLRQVESFGPDGGLSDGPLGCAAVRYQYDSKNRLIQETFFGADGKPGENRYLVVAAHHAYDEQDRRVETRFYDKDGKPAEDHLGVHRRLYREGTDSLEYRSDGTRRVRWLPPINLGRRINAASSWHPAISFDAREMYFSSGWTGITYTALQEVVRTTWSVDHWSSPERVRVAGRPARGLRAALSSDGKLMAVVGWKRSPPGMHDSVVDPVFPQLPNYGLADIYIFERNGGEWQRVRNAGPKINRANEEGGAAFAPGTYTLYFSANLPDKPSELWVSDYEKGDWGEPRAVGIGDVWEPAFSPEGRRLFFVSKRKGSFGGDDIWMAEKQAAGWARPINLGTEVNGGGDDSRPSLTLNGNVLYYCSCCPWNLVATGHADSEIAIRHMANLYAWSDSP